MVDTAFSVVVKAAECLVAVASPIAQHFSYIRNYETNFDKLEIELQKLKGQRDRVQNSVGEARRNGDQIEQLVNEWLDRVHTIIAEVSKVIEENERADMICFMGLCPNPKKRYQQSSKAVEKTKVVAGLYNEGNFPTVSFRNIPEETWIPSYKGYMVFESRMSTLKNILDELSNPDVNMIGIHGTGGIGKTTLAREIAQHAEDKKLFNAVAFAEVAVKPDIKEIQHEIADKLGLRFQDESRSGRARSLQERLKQEEKVLLVLDNIWERLNLEDVGIPFGNDHKGCKLLLTARSLDVLSNKMDSQSNFKVDFLDKGEAWSLFEKKAGSCDHLQALAKNVAKACGGLPIAIDSVAVALKTKEEFEWKDALTKLTTPSSSNFEGVAAETYSSIEISYSQLKERELKSTFLLCCIMGYANVEDLLGYGMGLGKFEDVEAMEQARNRVNTLVRKLKDSSLLLDINNKISLHDVVRDVGRSIASRDGHMFTVMNNCIPREWVGKDILKNCVGISLYNINKLPEEFECPELQFFYVRTTNVPNNFFAGMPKLKVLHLAGLELNLVPNSIRLLVNLRTLYIYDCKLRDVDFIGEFKQLEILRIHGSYDSKIEMIPKKMCNLTGLRLLDLSDCSIRNIPPNVISTFTRLEELYLPTGVFRKCEIEWEVEGVNILDELKHLMHLTTLKTGIKDANVLSRGCFSLKKLERYEIIIGNKKWIYKANGTSRMVQLYLETSSCSDDVHKFLSVLDGRGFPELEHLHVENSPCFRAIVDCLESESCHHFLSLQSLSLDSVLNLEMIHNYPLKDKADSFRQLRTIKVQFCHKLKNILSFSTYRALPLLEEVNVSSCNNMEEIFAIRGEEEINNNEGIDQTEFKHLRTITVHECNKLKNILSFSTYRALPLLERVYVSSCDNMEEIFAIRREEEINNNEGIDQTEFKHLRTVTVCECNKLKNILSFSTYRALPLLERVCVFSCDNMEEIFAIRREEEINNNEGIDQIEFKHLRTITVCECNKLKNILSFSTYRALPLLEEVYVSFCNNMEEIFAIRGEEDINNIEGTDQIEFKHLSSLALTSLPKLTYFCSINNNKDMLDTPTLLFNQKVVFSNLEALELCWINFEKIWHSELPAISSCFQGLRQLSIEKCSNLKVVFSSSTVSFSSLEVIEISKMDDLETIWSNQLCNDSFCNLRSLNVTRCNKLLTIFRSNMLERLTRLEYLTICDCDLVEEIFDLQGVNFEESHSEVESRLRKLVINGLPKLKHIWNKDPQKTFSFQKLNNVKIHHCMSLKYLFPVSIAESLSELEKLDVYYCGVEEFVVGDQGEANVAATFVFPQITSLEFNQLPQLKTFYCGVHTSQWQNLKRLTMCGCDKVELFASELFNFQENNEGQHGSSIQPLFIVKKVTFPILEEIKISDSNNLKILWQKGAKESFCNLKSVEVSRCNELLTIVQFNTLEGLSIPKLLTVTISNCASVEEIFDLQKVNLEESHSRAVMYHQLQQLNINWLPKLKHIWNKDPQKVLSFQKLNSVKIHHCMSLKYLFPVSIAESLRELEQLSVDNCEVEEIVADDQGEAKVAPTFVFPRITSLELNYLPQLKTFYCGVHTSQWQNLKRLTMHDCDKVELFASELFNFQENNGGQHGSSIQPLFIVEKVTFPILEEIKISDSNNLKILWQKGAKESFCNLKSVEVSRCNELLTIVQFNTLEGLSIPKLLTVTISNCASVEEIFDLQKVNLEESHSRAVMYHQLQQLNINWLPKLKHIWNKDPQKVLSFQKLNSVKIHHCMSLKYLFPVSIAESLRELEQLSVDNCEVEEIVADDQGEAKVAPTFVFPRITSLELNYLPQLKTFYCGVHTSQWQNLKRLTMHDCNKVELFASELFNFQENNGGQHGSSVQPLFIVEKVTFPSLEEIKISKSNKLKILWQKGDKESFCNLKSVEVNGCDELLTIFQFNTLEGLSIPKLLTVTISNCASVEEIFDLQKVNFEESHSRAVMYQLQELNLEGLPKLKHIWKKDPQAELSFEELPMPKSLKVRYCGSIEEIFDLQKVNFEESHSRAVMYQLQELNLEGLPKLKHIWKKDPQAELSFEELPMPKSLKVRYCDSIEEIFDLQKVNFEESHSRAVMYQLQELNLEGLPKLKHIWKKDPQAELSFEELPMPKSLKVRYCDSIEEIFDLQKVNFEESHSRAVMYQLQELNLEGLPKLKHIWKKDPQAELSFEELPMPKSLKVRYCGSIEEIFDLQKVNFEESHSRAVMYQLQELNLEGLPKLKHIWKKDPQAELSFEELPMPKSLKVRYCDSIEEIFDLQKVNFEESHSRAVMYQLQELNLEGLPKLKHIWKKDPQAELSFEELPMPKSLKVRYCDSIEEIFDLQKVNFEESHSRAVMYQLQELNLEGLPKLKHIWKKDPQAELSFEELPMPKSLKVRYCGSIEEIFDLQKVNFEESHSRAVMYQLQELNLEGLPKLKHIWNKDPQVALSFESLQQVKVSGCRSLKDLFPASIARNLSQLVQLNVDRCGQLEEIVAKEEEAKEAVRFVFPKVTSITLDRLPQLRTFFRGVHSSKWEVLKELEVVGCDKIELLASQLSCFQENNNEESYIDISVQPPFFLVEKDSFPILEKLILIGGGARMMLQFSEELFCKLKFLHVYNDKSVVLFPLRILQRFCHLHELHLKSSSYKEIFLYEEDETHVGVDSKLENLTVRDCQNLIQLVPSSTSFQNLTVLKVWSCDGLKNLMTSSTAKRLVQLREMAIGSCKSMIDVVAKGGDVTEDKIIFSELRTLRLADLPSLSCFCSEKYTFELPSLEEIIVYKCPEMNYFSLGDITTRILQKVRRGSMDYTLEGGLNTTIQKTRNSRVDDSRDLVMEHYIFTHNS